MRTLCVALVGFAAVAACGDGGSPLAPDDPEPATSAAAGGAGGSGGAAASTSSGQGGEVKIEEPDGPTAITVVNGLVDADAARFCLVPFPGGAPAALPWPGPGGLPFARGESLSTLPEAVDHALWALTGDLAATNGASCDDLVDAPPEGLTVRSLGVIPGTSLGAPRSLLLVAAGCVGGEGHEAENQEAICGVGYDAAFGNATLYAGFMSRLGSASVIPLQFVHASPATGLVDLRVRATSDAAATLVEPAFSLGAVAPFPPYEALQLASVSPPGQARVGIYPQGAPTTPVREWSWADAFANSELGEGDVANGLAMTFVVVGASAEAGAGPWWQPTSLTVVTSDP